MVFSPQQLEEYSHDGFIVARKLFSANEVATLIHHYMKLRQAGSYPGDVVADTELSNDPLHKFPRMIHMHYWDEASLRWLLDERLKEGLTELLGSEPLAVQTMLYFKPPGARGQALHQDNFYLRVRPGTCMAAWLSLDACDEENGCMRIVPGSHLWPVLCPSKADTTRSFTDVTVPLPDGIESIPVVMGPGDVLFFNGSVVHGSFPNTSADRFRRALIGHYINGAAEQLSQWYERVLKMDGSTIEVPAAPEGGRCGVWVDRDGTGQIEEIGTMPGPKSVVN